MELTKEILSFFNPLIAMAMGNLVNQLKFRFGLCSLFFLLTHTAKSQNIISDTRGTSAIPLNPVFTEPKKDDAAKSPVIEETSFNLGLIKFTTAEKKIELNQYGYFVIDSTNTILDRTDLFLGISASAEIKNSIANVFSSNNVVSGGEANIRAGVRLTQNRTNWKELLKGKDTAERQKVLDDYTKPANDLWLIATGGFSGSSFKLFQPDWKFR